MTCTSNVVAVQGRNGTFLTAQKLILFFGVLKLLIHLAGLGNYGLHADELYYIALSKHLQWGFLDISPFVTWVAKLSELLFGSQTFAWRIFPCLFSSATVMLTGYMAYDFGGGRLSIVLACSALICSPAFLATSYLLQPVVFDEFFWTLFAYAIIRFQRSQQHHHLYLAATALGLGLLNKYTILMYFGSLASGIMLVSPKIFGKWFRQSLIPGLLVLLVVLPNLIWQWQHHFPIFNYLGIVGKGAFALDLGDYLFQLIFFHGAGVAVWTAGFFYLIFVRRDHLIRQIWPVSFIVVIIALALLKGKLYYALGIFPVFFASGGTCWALMLKPVKKKAKAIFIAMLYLFAMLSFPLVVPVLPVTTCRIYIRKMVQLTHFSRPLRWEDGQYGSIPQFFADMSGWQELSGKISLYRKLTKAQGQQISAVLTDNYAITGALKHYNTGLPVFSASNSFLAKSPPVLPNGNILYLSKENPVEVGKLASQVDFLETLKMENSHLNGIHIYLLHQVNGTMQRKYQQERQRFFPNGN